MATKQNVLRYATSALFALFGLSLLFPVGASPDKLSLWLFILASICAMLLVGLKTSRPVAYREAPGKRVPTLSALVPVVCAIVCVNVCAAIYTYGPHDFFGTDLSDKQVGRRISLIALSVYVTVAKMLDASGYPRSRIVDEKRRKPPAV